jgi:hypothetical protein
VPPRDEGTITPDCGRCLGSRRRVPGRIRRQAGARRRAIVAEIEILPVRADVDEVNTGTRGARRVPAPPITSPAGSCVRSAPPHRTDIDGVGPEGTALGSD